MINFPIKSVIKIYHRKLSVTLEQIISHMTVIFMSNNSNCKFNIMKLNARSLAFLDVTMQGGDGQSVPERNGGNYCTKHKTSSLNGVYEAPVGKLYISLLIF